MTHFLPTILAFSLIALSTAKAELVVFAAASSMDVMNKVAVQYEQEKGGKVRFNFASSGTLARQIEAGAPADIFLSANARWMDYLQELNHIKKATRFNLASNRLVMIAPLHSPLVFGEAIEGKVAVGDFKNVPAGMYAKEALKSLDWLEKYRDNFVMTANVRTALMYVECGEVEAGIVYTSDARQSDKVIILGTFPEKTHRPITYPIAACNNTDEATQFLAFLRADTSTDIFRSFGFTEALPEAIEVAPVEEPREEHSIFHANPIILSLKVALGGSLIVIVPAILLGWLLARKEFRGKFLVEGLVHAPLVVPPVVTGYLLLLLFGSNGVFSTKLAFSSAGAVLVAVIVSLPLAVRSVRLAISMVDRRLEEVAMTLGHPPMRIFFRTTLPLAWPGILGGTLLAFSRSLGEFGATITFAGNIQGVTQTLPLAIYSSLQVPGEENRALFLSLFSIGLCVMTLIISEYLVRKAGTLHATHC